MKRMMPKHYRALDLMMAGLTDNQICDALGMKTRKTLIRWRSQPMFQAEWEKRREDLMQKGADRAKDIGDVIIDTLIDAMQNANPMHAVQAAWYAHRIRMELDERMSKAAVSEHNLLVPVDDAVVTFLLRQYGSRESAGEAFAEVVRKAARESVPA